MALSRHALLFQITKDLRPYLSVDQEIAALMGGTLPIYPDSEVEGFASAHLLNNVFKKLVTEVADDADKKALDKFEEANSLCKQWTWGKNTWSLFDEILVGEFKRIVYDVFSDSLLCFSNLESIHCLGDLGPGSNVGGGDTDFYTKMYGSALTSSNPALLETFLRSVSVSGGIRSWQAEFVRQLHWGHKPDIRDSKLSFVPKTDDISRTICSEPTLNMWYQKAYGSLIEAKLRSRFGINLSNQQDINRGLCREGSKTGRFATIDLKSASDSISLALLNDILPREVMSLLRVLRSSHTVYPDGTVVELNMVSSMGNGFTFPLQTILFCCMVEAVYCVLDIQFKKNTTGRHPVNRDHNWIIPGNFCVFGDDIIVVDEAFEATLRLLRLCGFRINGAKSFSKGTFRESCGEDYYLGHNVRPVCLKDLESEHSLFTAINLFRYWSARTSIPLRHSISLMASKVRTFLVPRSMPVESGIHVPFSIVKPKRLDPNGSYCFRALRDIPKRYFVGHEAIRIPKFGKRKQFNPDGLILYFLRGDIRRGCFAVRSSESDYRVRSYVTPNWDYTPWGQDLLDPVGWSRWESESVRLFHKLT